VSRSSNQKRKRKARVATGVPCERPAWIVGEWIELPAHAFGLSEDEWQRFKADLRSVAPFRITSAEVH